MNKFFFALFAVGMIMFIALFVYTVDWQRRRHNASGEADTDNGSPEPASADLES